MNDQTRKLLFDVLDSGRAIRQWRAGRSYDEYLSDRQFRRAVEREFEIIGEALHRRSEADADIAAQIAELPRIDVARHSKRTATARACVLKEGQVPCLPNLHRQAPCP